MRRVLTMAGLTVRAAVRYRLFGVLALLLALTVVVLPLVILHDGTARGFTQITLTYTLGVTTVLLGFVTLWLGCGVLAREIEECQLQMVDVKPVARWQVWLGKWLGIMALNSALLLLTAACVYGTLLYRARQLPTQPVDQRAILFNEVLVARVGVREAPTDLNAAVDRLLAAARERGLPPGTDERALRLQLLREQQAAEETVPVNSLRRWIVDVGPQARQAGRPLHLRVKFYTADWRRTQEYPLEWTVGPLDGVRQTLAVPPLLPDTFHEIPVPAELVGRDGRLVVDAANRTDAALVFPLADGLEVLYREASFTVNLLRALGIILCWLGLLTALGLAAGSGLSFPVAAFVALSLLFMALLSGTMAGIVEQGYLQEPEHEHEHEAGAAAKRTWVDVVVLPVFRAILGVVQFGGEFAPISALSTGRSITWTTLGVAFLKILLVLGGACAAAGIGMFSRREIAAARVSP
jgi:ABC-type transport system involved in multi-copper enzyme maturation permease subunit